MRIQSAYWIIDARWIYAPAAFLLGFIAFEEENTLGFSMEVLVGALLFVLVANIFFYRFLKRHGDVQPAREKLWAFNVAQVAIDLVFFFIILLFTGGGVESVGHSFFFIPIIVSMILFGFRGAIILACASGILVFLSALAHAGGAMLLFKPFSSWEITESMSLAITESGIIFVIYLLTGFFGGYVSRLIHTRDLLLLEEVKKEEDHVKRLEELSREFDKSAKLLVRRDLELSTLNEKLTELDKMKSEIISIVAHQLRTPLSAIKWTLKILLDQDLGKITPEQEEVIKKSFESNERMITLVNDMLAVDRLESGRIKYTFVPVQFEDLIHDMLRSLSPLAAQRGVKTSLSLPTENLPKIKIDPDKIRDVLQNLIDNAIKYTKPNTTVEVGLTFEGRDFHFWVKDSGIGIPQGEQGKIFSRFFRATNAMTQQTNGSGLGLFIAQSIVKRHGGKVWFESTENVGSVFHVLLPLVE